MAENISFHPMSKIIEFDKNKRRSGTDYAWLASHAQAGFGQAARKNTTAVIVNSAPAADMLVSVVVPTCNRPQLLRRCLKSLLSQRFNFSRYEIIVVDDEPSRSTHDVVLEVTALSKRAPAVVYIINQGTHGPAAARNRGWQAARGTIIAFTDDDTIAQPDWLHNGLRAFDADVQAVCGRIVMPPPSSPRPTDSGCDAKGLKTAEFATANCFCPKHVLEELGGFDERFRDAWGEDADLYFRLLGRSGRIVHAPAAMVTHPVRPCTWRRSLRQQKKMQFDALLYKKHPQLYRQKICAHPCWDHYLAAASLLALIGGLLAGKPALAAGTALIWLFMTMRFWAMRLAATAKTPLHVVEMIVTSALIPPVAVFWRLVGAARFRVSFM